MREFSNQHVLFQENRPVYQDASGKGKKKDLTNNSETPSDTREKIEQPKEFKPKEILEYYRVLEQQRKPEEHRTSLGERIQEIADLTSMRWLESLEVIVKSSELNEQEKKEMAEEYLKQHELTRKNIEQFQKVALATWYELALTLSSNEVIQNVNLEAGVETQQNAVQELAFLSSEAIAHLVKDDTVRIKDVTTWDNFLKIDLSKVKSINEAERNVLLKCQEIGTKQSKVDKAEKTVQGWFKNEWETIVRRAIGANALLDMSTVKEQVKNLPEKAKSAKEKIPAALEKIADKTVDFAQKHPYVTAVLLYLGARMIFGDKLAKAEGRIAKLVNFGLKAAGTAGGIILAGHILKKLGVTDWINENLGIDMSVEGMKKLLYKKKDEVEEEIIQKKDKAIEMLETKGKEWLDKKLGKDKDDKPEPDDKIFKLETESEIRFDQKLTELEIDKKLRYEIIETLRKTKKPMLAAILDFRQTAIKYDFYKFSSTQIQGIKSYIETLEDHLTDEELAEIKKLKEDYKNNPKAMHKAIRMILLKKYKEAAENIKEKHRKIKLLAIAAGALFETAKNAMECGDEILSMEIQPGYLDSLTKNIFPKFTEQDQILFQKKIGALPDKYYELFKLEKSSEPNEWLCQLGGKAYIFKIENKKLVIYYAPEPLIVQSDKYMTDKMFATPKVAKEATNSVIKGSILHALKMLAKRENNEAKKKKLLDFHDTYEKDGFWGVEKLHLIAYLLRAGCIITIVSPWKCIIAGPDFELEVIGLLGYSAETIHELEEELIISYKLAGYSEEDAKRCVSEGIDKIAKAALKTGVAKAVFMFWGLGIQTVGKSGEILSHGLFEVSKGAHALKDMDFAKRLQEITHKITIENLRKNVSIKNTVKNVTKVGTLPFRKAYTTTMRQIINKNLVGTDKSVLKLIDHVSQSKNSQKLDKNLNKLYQHVSKEARKKGITQDTFLNNHFRELEFVTRNTFQVNNINNQIQKIVDMLSKREKGYKAATMTELDILKKHIDALSAQNKRNASLFNEGVWDNLINRIKAPASDPAYLKNIHYKLYTSQESVAEQAYHIYDYLSEKSTLEEGLKNVPKKFRKKLNMVAYDNALKDSLDVVNDLRSYSYGKKGTSEFFKATEHFSGLVKTGGEMISGGTNTFFIGMAIKEALWDQDLAKALNSWFYTIRFFGTMRLIFPDGLLEFKKGEDGKIDWSKTNIFYYQDYQDPDFSIGKLLGQYENPFKFAETGLGIVTAAGGTVRLVYESTLGRGFAKYMKSELWKPFADTGHFLGRSYTGAKHLGKAGLHGILAFVPEEIIPNFLKKLPEKLQTNIAALPAAERQQVAILIAETSQNLETKQANEVYKTLEKYKGHELSKAAKILKIAGRLGGGLLVMGGIYQELFIAHNSWMEARQLDEIIAATESPHFKKALELRQFNKLTHAGGHAYMASIPTAHFLSSIVEGILMERGVIESGKRTLVSKIAAPGLTAFATIWLAIEAKQQVDIALSDTLEEWSKGVGDWGKMSPDILIRQINRVSKDTGASIAESLDFLSKDDQKVTLEEVRKNIWESLVLQRYGNFESDPQGQSHLKSKSLHEISDPENRLKALNAWAYIKAQLGEGTSYTTFDHKSVERILNEAWRYAELRTNIIPVHNLPHADDGKMTEEEFVIINKLVKDKSQTEMRKNIDDFVSNAESEEQKSLSLRVRTTFENLNKDHVPLNELSGVIAILDQEKYLTDTTIQEGIEALKYLRDNIYQEVIPIDRSLGNFGNVEYAKKWMEYYVFGRGKNPNEISNKATTSSIYEFGAMRLRQESGIIVDPEENSSVLEQYFSWERANVHGFYYSPDDQNWHVQLVGESDPVVYNFWDILLNMRTKPSMIFFRHPSREMEATRDKDMFMISLREVEHILKPFADVKGLEANEILDLIFNTRPRFLNQKDEQQFFDWVIKIQNDIHSSDVGVEQKKKMNQEFITKLEKICKKFFPNGYIDSELNKSALFLDALETLGSEYRSIEYFGVRSKKIPIEVVYSEDNEYIIFSNTLKPGATEQSQMAYRILHDDQKEQDYIHYRGGNYYITEYSQKEGRPRSGKIEVEQYLINRPVYKLQGAAEVNLRGFINQELFDFYINPKLHRSEGVKKAIEYVIKAEVNNEGKMLGSQIAALHLSGTGDTPTVTTIMSSGGINTISFQVYPGGKIVKKNILSTNSLTPSAKEWVESVQNRLATERIERLQGMKLGHEMIMNSKNLYEYQQAHFTLLQYKDQKKWFKHPKENWFITTNNELDNNKIDPIIYKKVDSEYYKSAVFKNPRNDFYEVKWEKMSPAEVKKQELTEDKRPLQKES